jgi:hypothetical protein
VLRPKELVLPEYLTWVLNHATTRDGMRGISRGTYIPFLSKADLEGLQVPVPALDVQHQIVSVARLRQELRRLAVRREQLTDQLVDAATWQAATDIKRKSTT